MISSVEFDTFNYSYSNVMFNVNYNGISTYTLFENFTYSYVIDILLILLTITIIVLIIEVLFLVMTYKRCMTFVHKSRSHIPFTLMSS